MGHVERIHRKLPYSLKKVLYVGIYRIPADKQVRWQWRLRFGSDLRLDQPQTYNERIQWLKVFGERRPDVFGDVALARICADKIAVRDYVAKEIGAEHLVPMLGAYSRLDEIPFENLPSSFVLKANHDSGSTVIVTDKSHMMVDQRRRLKALSFRLGINYGRLTKEWVYTQIVPRVIVEPLISADHRKELWDYKVFVFSGEPRLIQVDVDRFGNHRRSFYTPDWKKADLAILYPPAEQEIPRPAPLKEVLEYSARLAEPFRHARVDWYVWQDRPLFGEITFFHESGFAPFSDHRWELEMGRWLAWDAPTMAEA